jgi:hypothetical protein
MSTDETDITPDRTPEQKLKALIQRDISDEITALAQQALDRRQEGSS